MIIKIIEVNQRKVLVSDAGRIWIYRSSSSVYKENLVKPFKGFGWFEAKQRQRGKRGYMSVSINHVDYYVHRLVAYAFDIYPSLSKIPGFDVDHIDNNNRNNRASNLQLLSRSCNRSKEHLHQLSQLGYHYEVYGPKEVGLISIHRSLNEVAEKLNVDASFISQCVRGLRHQCKGYTVKKVSHYEVQ